MGNCYKLKLSDKFQLLRSRHWLGGFQDIEAFPVPSGRGVLPSYMPRHGQSWRPMQDRRRLWVYRRVRLGQGLRTMRRWVHLPDSLPGILKYSQTVSLEGIDKRKWKGMCCGARKTMGFHFIFCGEGKKWNSVSVKWRNPGENGLWLNAEHRQSQGFFWYFC